MPEVDGTRRRAKQGTDITRPPIWPAVEALVSLAMQMKVVTQTVRDRDNVVSGNATWRPVLRREMEAEGWSRTRGGDEAAGMIGIRVTRRWPSS